MNELIEIQKHNFNGSECNAVNARDLYEYLEVKRDFSDWIKDQLVDFIEGESYSLKLGNRVDGKAGKPRREYILTIDTAKHIAMLNRSNKGREIRNYFIEFEKTGQQLKLALYNDPVIKLRLDQIEMEKRIKGTETTLQQIQGKMEQTKTDLDYFTIVGYASFIHKSIDLSTAQILGKRAKRMCNEMGYIVGSIPDPRFGRLHTYEHEVLEIVFNNFFKKE